MYNRVSIIGSVWEIKNQEDKNIYMKVSTTRPFVNNNFEYTRDFLNIVIWKEYYQEIKKLIKVGMMISLEGRVESKVVNDEKVKPNNFIVAERIFTLCRDQVHCLPGENILKNNKNN